MAAPVALPYPSAVSLAALDTAHAAVQANPASERIAFVSDRDGNAEIYVMNADGGGVHRLTDNPATDTMPAWSPDGARISFVSARDGNYEIYVMNADGSSLRRLTEDPGLDTNPTWSPDGRRIAFESDRVGGSTANDRDTAIFIMAADGSDLVQHTVSGFPDAEFGPDWSPDGSTLAIYSTRRGQPEIAVVGAERGSPVLQLTTNFAIDSSPAWSPAGSAIAFSSQRDGNAEIYVLQRASGLEQRLTNDTAIDSLPTWSPDGNHIAFNSDRTGNDEIYVMAADGSGVVNLTNHPANDFAADWIAVRSAGDAAPVEPVPPQCMPDRKSTVVISDDRTRLMHAICRLAEVTVDKIETDTATVADRILLAYELTQHEQWVELGQYGLALFDLATSLPDLDKATSNLSASAIADLMGVNVADDPLAVLKLSGLFVAEYNAMGWPDKEYEVAASLNQIRYSEQHRYAFGQLVREAETTFVFPISRLELYLRDVYGPIKARAYTRAVWEEANLLIASLPDPLPVDFPVDDFLSSTDLLREEIGRSNLETVRLTHSNTLLGNVGELARSMKELQVYYEDENVRLGVLVTVGAVVSLGSFATGGAVKLAYEGAGLVLGTVDAISDLAARTDPIFSYTPSQMIQQLPYAMLNILPVEIRDTYHATSRHFAALYDAAHPEAATLRTMAMWSESENLGDFLDITLQTPGADASQGTPVYVHSGLGKPALAPDCASVASFEPAIPPDGAYVRDPSTCRARSSISRASVWTVSTACLRRMGSL
jgi:Tol biopolymer transport system component